MKALDILSDNKTEIYNSGDKYRFTVDQQFTAMFIRDLAISYDVGDYIIINYKLEKHRNFMIDTLQKLGFIKIVCSIKTSHTENYFYNRKIKGVAIKIAHISGNKESIKVTKIDIDDLIDRLGRDYIECNELLNDIDGLREYKSYRDKVSRIKLADEISELSIEDTNLECTSALNSLSTVV